MAKGKLVRVMASAKAYYTKTVWDGEVWITEDLFNSNKEKIESIEMYVYDLNGKHSEDEADITVEVFSREEAVKLVRPFDSQELRDSLTESFLMLFDSPEHIDILKESFVSGEECDDLYESLDKLGLELLKEHEELEPVKHSLVLTRAVTIQGVKIPKGTLVHWES